MVNRGRSEELCCELDRVASEIDDGLLSFASPEARHEWVSVRARWQPPSPLAAADDLGEVVEKIRRFSGILKRLKAESVARAERRATKA